MFSLRKKILNFRNPIILLTVVLYVSDCNNVNNLTYYISSGTTYDKHDLGKYVVSIQLNRHTGIDKYFGQYHFCGGSLIGERKVLTAAHCLEKPTGKRFKPHEIVVVIGLRHRFTRTNITRIKEVAYVVPHKKFKMEKTLYADIGYLILKDAILFDNSATGIIELNDTPPMRYQNCTVIGWGKLFDKGPASDELAFVDVNVLGRNVCKRKYNSSFTSGMLCAADPDNWRKDACSGDSGGPLICREKIVGIVSWGIGCGRNNTPGVYTDVYYFKRWIESGERRILIPYAVAVIWLIQFVM